MDETKTPILVGSGQITQREPDVERALSPIDLTAAAASTAIEDTGAGDALLKSIDTMVLIRSFSDTSWRFKCPFGKYSNPPLSLANRLGAENVKRHIYTHPGGNMPQWCVNRMFEMIARGEMEIGMIAGGEALATQKNAQRKKTKLNWDEDIGDQFKEWGIYKRGWSNIEDRHGMSGAIFAYPLIENAIRGHEKRSIEDHSLAMGKLFSKFASIAANNPLADRRQSFSANEIASVNSDNPYIGFPYTKLMNSNAFIDQSAALILTSVAKAKELNIPREKWVYLHGCADAYDHWFLSDRINFYSSPAMSVVARETFEMADCTIDDIDLMDLYSCFPSAVEIACNEMKISQDDPRGLTITGGLPYFGGPGNNYVTHSIAEMIDKVRSRPGSKGLITANGNYITKQSAGIYSTEPIDKQFSPKNPSIYQAEINSKKGPSFTEFVSGNAVIETYTIIHDREGPSFGIIFGRLEDDSRFIANTPKDIDLMLKMTTEDFLGVSGNVKNSEGINIFTPK